MSYTGNIGLLRKSVYVKSKSKRCKSLKEKLKNKNRRLIEKILLDELGKISTNRKGEWFEVDVDKAISLFNN